jgi:sulfite exporter TauE/SafE
MLYAAFLLGLVSSLHCLGMCGPIALALPVAGGGAGRKVVGRLLYNAGRIGTYALLGLGMGFFGRGLSLVLSQQQLSVAVGVLLLAFVLLPPALTGRLGLTTPAVRFTNGIKARFARLLRQRSLPVLFGIGVLNGLLPCGMVYVALGGALATADAWTGTAYMALFGLGTAPLMLMVGLGSEWLKGNWRSAFRRAAPAFTVALALLLLLRGLNLGIPLLSPALEKSPTAQVKLKCCQKGTRSEK